MQKVVPMDTNIKALVAEDDRALADIIRIALVRAGYQVTVAHDGMKARAYATQSKFDVVISDYQMPLLNGRLLLSGIRAGGASQGALLFLCSSKSFEIDIDQLRTELGLTAVFFKPFSLGELVATIKSHQIAALA
jgi:DNA-binding response OmpR family regulator